MSFPKKIIARQAAKVSRGVVNNGSTATTSESIPGQQVRQKSSIMATTASKFTESVQYCQMAYYNSLEETKVPLQNMIAVNIKDKNDVQDTLNQVASFLRRELPVRIAHRAYELESNELFKRSKSITQVANCYKNSFQEIIDCPEPIDANSERVFANILEGFLKRHSSTLIKMARGVHELRCSLKQDRASFADEAMVQRVLDAFYMSRIDIRTLIGQYLALRKPRGNPNNVGMISTRASPYYIAKEAITDAAELCIRTHGIAPEVTIHGRTDLTFPYVSSHISYILLELLKNSMRATVETHGVDKMPRIRVIIADGEDNEDVVIKVSDEGGGIKRSNMNRIWSYLYTTADHAVLDRLLGSSSSSNADGSDSGSDSGSSSDSLQDTDAASPLAGLGYGLPLSRNYARYFGGELTIMSMEGYGTDGSLYLPRVKVKKPV